MPACVVQVVDSLVAGNAGGSGGVVLLCGTTTGTINITNSTVYGNKATVNGGVFSFQRAVGLSFQVRCLPAPCLQFISSSMVLRNLQVACMQAHPGLA